MGYGGALIWTGLARNLQRQFPKKKIVFIYRRLLKDALLARKSSDHEIYRYNPDIFLIVDYRLWFFLKWFYRPEEVIEVNMSDPSYFYCKKSTDYRIEYKTGTHAIQIACNRHDIADAELRGRIVLTPAERSYADNLLMAHSLHQCRFVCIEPHTKDGFTPNKAWFWDCWQRLVDLLNAYIENKGYNLKIAQIGQAGNRVLDGVVDLTGRTTFRQAGRILEHSLGFIGCMGGLVHLSRAVGKKSVVLISAWEPHELVSYDDDYNFYSDVDCKHCGLKIPCPFGRRCMMLIQVENVFKACKGMIDDARLVL